METIFSDPTGNNLPDDILEGAHAIAEFLFGPDDKGRNRRKVYHIVETGRLPGVPVGIGSVCSQVRPAPIHRRARRQSP